MRAVLRQIPGLQIINEHLHVSYERMAMIANEVLGRIPPAIAFVRNPYAWYVSMWGIVWWYPQLTFVGTFREYMEVIRDQAIDNPNFVTMTQHWEAMGADKARYHGSLELGRLEEIHDWWFVPMLYRHLHDLIDEQSLAELVEKQPRFHPAIEWPSRQRTKHYSHYYDAEMRRWVEDWDADLIQRFGYGFENHA